MNYWMNYYKKSVFLWKVTQWPIAFKRKNMVGTKNTPKGIWWIPLEDKSPLCFLRKMHCMRPLHEIHSTCCFHPSAT